MTTPEGQDAAEWTDRFRGLVAEPRAYTAPSPANARPWTASIFGCFDPIDTCLVTCCCPCVTFGKTHHRVRKGADMTTYSPFNVSCLGWYAASCCGVHWIMNMMQRHDIREKGNLEGDIVTDCLLACCCSCCDLIQQEKEAQYLAVPQQPMANQPGLKSAMAVPETVPAQQPAPYQDTIYQSTGVVEPVPQTTVIPPTDDKVAPIHPIV
ncbi:MAG: hypothetical protein M1818_001051 [Claussenomyces sp. TS43310]|nr:MAG: hypothetical protein M1818_001051 [Claussenomyces sp. TS43310]